MLTDDEKRKLKSLQVTHTIGSPRSTDSQDWASSGLLLKAEEHQNNITVSIVLVCRGSVSRVVRGESIHMVPWSLMCLA